LAENLMPFEGIAAPVLDARRDQVYNALFTCQDGRLVRLCEDRVLPLGELMAELRETYPDTPVLFAGDAYDKAVSRAEAATLTLTPVEKDKRLPNGAAVARLGYAAYLRGECISGEELAPVYLRLPQAERERLEREHQKSEDK
jgi:tRNA threonylcarbamoyladenosine biosynthesis protein TsaB